MATHHPMRKNPGVVIESILQLLPVLTQSPHIDVRKLMEEIIHGMGMPSSVLTPPQDAAMAAAVSQQQQLMMAGATTPDQANQALEGTQAALMGAEGPASPEDALAAGGGAPIRDAGPPAEAK